MYTHQFCNLTECTFIGIFLTMECYVIVKNEEIKQDKKSAVQIEIHVVKSRISLHTWNMVWCDGVGSTPRDKKAKDSE